METSYFWFCSKKIIKFTSIFYKLRSILTNDCIKQIYYALVYPHLLYGVEIYANTFDNHIDPLLKLNNKILRVLQKQSRITPIRNLYLNYNTLQISDLHKFQIYCFVHKFIYNREKLPPAFNNYFTFNHSVHDHFTRKFNELHKSVSNKIFGFNHIKEKGPRLWNNLPLELKSIKSFINFKRYLKNWLLINME